MKKLFMYALIFSQIIMAQVLSADDKPWELHGSAHYKMDATFWWLDDSFSSNLVDLETSRETILFQEIHGTIKDVLGFDLSLDAFLDKILQSGKEEGSGGININLQYGITELFKGSDFDIGNAKANLFFDYTYRKFAWTSKILKHWLDSRVDYFDENGNQKVYNLGDSIVSSSVLNNFVLGTEFVGSLEDFGNYRIAIGLNYWDLFAPTLIDLAERDTLTYPSADIIMMTHNTFFGVNLVGSVGVNRKQPIFESSIISAGFELGVTIGSYKAFNDYFDGPADFSALTNASLTFGLPLEFGATVKGSLLFGLEGSFSIFANFGSASEPGKLKKNLPYHSIGSTYNMPAGTILDVDISRWEGYGGPFVTLGINF